MTLFINDYVPKFLPNNEANLSKVFLPKLSKKKRIADKDAEYAAMAKDPDFLAEQDFFMDFCGDVSHEPW